MRLKDLHLKLKALRLKRLVWGFNEGRRRRRRRIKKKPSWMNPVSHGCHVIDQRIIGGYCPDDYECDSVVVRREQNENAELWYFGIFDALIGDGVTKYMQSHLFQKQLKESHISRKCKETLNRAYLSLRAKMKLDDETISRQTSSVSAMVINGEKLVTAQIGHCKAVVCRDGIAYHTNPTSQHLNKAPHWTRKLFSGGRKSRNSSELVRAERIDSDTEFLILATDGIWDVMKNQEAVNLIRHIENPNEAAKCLANEALNRLSKSNISCIIIRFD